MEFESIRNLRASILERNPLQSEYLARSLQGVLREELQDLDAYVSFGQSLDLDIAYFSECYDLIVKDMLREQMYFRRHGKYRYSNFDEVANSVYFDDDYMRKYMHGLAITSYLWPHQREIHRYFRNKLPTGESGNYLEIGPGHGIYMLNAMRNCVFDHYDGIDISPTSAEMTRCLIGSGKFGSFDNYRIFEQDFLSGDISDASYSAVVMGEVLEHVEQPSLFLETIKRIAKDDAFIFITTPINAPAIDHIYLFESWDAIERLVTEAGLAVQDKLLIPYPGLSLAESEAQSLPINAAMVLHK